jgi:DNA-binding NtrC family response regulator
MSHVLIVDDEPSICWGFRELLSDEGHEVSVASSAEEALELAARHVPDAVVMDVRLPGRDGLSTIGELRRQVADAPIIIMTAFGSLDTAVGAINQGAFDYLAKPFDLEQAAETVRRALRRRQPSPQLEDQVARTTEEAFIGSSPAMQAVYKLIALAAPSSVPVLITGQSGTGKELVARAIHRHSPRKEAPFVPISLAALNSALIESELFGHGRGSFTGADSDRVGFLEMADGGTVLLDEIGDVPLPVQVKLLRAIEQHEVIRVGEGRARRTDFRVLAATNRPLTELVARGEFREDLYYRLGVFRIEVPPLRERSDDIPLLAEYFLQQTAGNRRPPRLSAEALRELRSRRWSGNVRELRNAVERAAVVARGEQIEPEHFPPPFPNPAIADPSAEEELRRSSAKWAAEQYSTREADCGDLLERCLRLVEPGLLESVLTACGQNRAAAARALGIHRSTLRQKLREYGLDRE